jgi:hypothetical protein
MTLEVGDVDFGVFWRSDRQEMGSGLPESLSPSCGFPLHTLLENFAILGGRWKMYFFLHLLVWVVDSGFRDARGTYHLD